MAGLFQFGSISCCCDDQCAPLTDTFRYEDISETVLEWDVSGTAERIEYLGDDVIDLNGSITTVVDNSNVNGRVISVGFEGLDGENIRVQFAQNVFVEFTINTDCNFILNKDDEVVGKLNIETTAERKRYTLLIYMGLEEVTTVLDTPEINENIALVTSQGNPTAYDLLKTNYTYPNSFTLSISSSTGIYLTAVSLNGLYDEENFPTCPRIPFKEQKCLTYLDTFNRIDSSDLGCDWDASGFVISGNKAVGSGLAKYIGPTDLVEGDGIVVTSLIKGNSFYLQINGYKLEYTFLSVVDNIIRYNAFSQVTSTGLDKFGIHLTGNGLDAYNVVNLRRDANDFYSVSFTSAPAVLVPISKNTVSLPEGDAYECHIKETSDDYQDQVGTSAACSVYVGLWQVYGGPGNDVFLDLPSNILSYDTIGFGAASSIEVYNFTIQKLNCPCGVPKMVWATTVRELNSTNVEITGNASVSSTNYQYNQPYWIPTPPLVINFGAGTSTVRIKKPSNSTNWAIRCSIPRPIQPPGINSSFSVQCGNNITTREYIDFNSCPGYEFEKRSRMYFNDKWIYAENELQLYIWGDYSWYNTIDQLTEPNPFFFEQNNEDDDYITITANNVYESAIASVQISSIRHYSEFSNATDIETLLCVPPCDFSFADPYYLNYSNQYLVRLFRRGILPKPYCQDITLTEYEQNCQQGIYNALWGIERQYPDRVYLTINSLVNTIVGATAYGGLCDGCATINGTYELRYEGGGYSYYEDRTICNNYIDCGLSIKLHPGFPNGFGGITLLYTEDLAALPPSNQPDQYHETYRATNMRLGITINSDDFGVGFQQLASDIVQHATISSYPYEHWEWDGNVETPGYIITEIDRYCPLYELPYTGPYKNTTFGPIGSHINGGVWERYILCSGGGGSLTVPSI